MKFCFQFKNGATQCFSTILEKFKEKKANVVAALVEAIDALYPCLGIEAVQVKVQWEAVKSNRLLI